MLILQKTAGKTHHLPVFWNTIAFKEKKKVSFGIGEGGGG